LNRFLQHLRTRGYYKGLLGGSRRWLVVWTVLITWRTLGRLMGNKPVVERFKLDQGETLLISDLGTSDPAS